MKGINIMQKVQKVSIDLFDSPKEPKKRAPSPSKVEKEERRLTTSEVHLIDYWIETGKLRKERSVPGDSASQDIYFFNHELVGDLELSMPWSEFFDVFNGMNHVAFRKELEGEIVDNPFDPWRNPRIVGVSIRIPPHNRQDYRLVEIFSPEDQGSKEVSDVESPANLGEDTLIVRFTRAGDSTQ